MTKRIAVRGVARLCVLAGAVVMSGSGCSDLTPYVDKNEAGVKDGKIGSGGSAGRKDGGTAGKAGSNGNSGSLVGGANGGAGGNPPFGGQSDSSSDAGVDAPVSTGGTAGSSSGAAGGGGTNVAGSTTTPASSGGATSPASSTRDAGYDAPVDHPTTACTTAEKCPAPTNGNGSAVCQGGVCGISCNQGYHRCGDGCLANNSTDSCGSSCSPCPKPASNGSATCGGNPPTCGIQCDNNFHTCGSNCVANGSTSGSSCGNNCAVCQAPANGSVTCNGINCVPKCNSGYHLCSGACKPNNSVESCGTGSCFPCRVPANGSPTCDGTKCDFECNSNFHKCGSDCFSNIDANHCGTDCKVCPGDPNGTPDCWAGVCRVLCKDGYHYCDDVKGCVPNGSRALESCGNSCEVCTPPEGFEATCNGTKCVYAPSPCLKPDEIRCVGSLCVKEGIETCGSSCENCTERTAQDNYSWECKNHACTAVCDSGFTNCAAVGAPPACLSVTSLANCGGSCSDCPDPGDYGDVSCAGAPLQCSITCDGTAHRCGPDDPICYLDDDASHCGSAGSCKRCTEAPGHARPACTDNECNFTCEDGFHRCDKDTADPCKQDGVPNSAFCGTECTECGTDEVCDGTSCVAITDAGVGAPASEP